MNTESIDVEPRKGSTICLNMIVKNEAHVIKRCLQSVKSHINYWVIVDTGSTDGTQDIIKEFLKDIPGELHERPWIDFAASRNEAIDLARGKADYLMVVDADDVIVGACPRNLHHSHYTLTVYDNGVEYERTHIFKSTMPFYYVGVLHEYLECDDKSAEAVRIPSLKYRRYLEGARSKDKATYAKDAEVLKKAAEAEKDPVLKSRYTFYQAQSYRDAGQYELAITTFEQRALMVGFLEEAFIALHQAAKLKVNLKRSDEEIEQSFLRAYEFRPSRIEAIYDLCSFLHSKGKYKKAFDYAKTVAHKTFTSDKLFVDRSIYTWRMKDDFALNAFYAGEKAIAKQAWEELLQNQNLPINEVERVKHNLQLASSTTKFWGPIPEVIAHVESLIQPGWKVLEIGPGGQPFSKATHFVTRQGEGSDTSKVVDVVKNRLPFADKEFDFVYCRHVVEDLIYPDLLLSEMKRVGKAGYIETPSPFAELTRGVDGGENPPHRGYMHHHWIVWNDSGTLKLVEKASVIEHMAFEDYSVRLANPIQWNTYFLWNDEFEFKRIQHEIDFMLYIDYGSVLESACTAASNSIDKMKSRLTE